MARTDWETRLEELDTGPDSSADLIEQQVLQIMLDAISDYPPQSPSTYTRWLLSLVRRVLGVHPLCGRLIGLFSRLLWSIEGLQAQEMNLAFLDGLQQWSGDTYLAKERLTEHATRALAQFKNLLAYSYTPTLRHSLVSVAQSSPDTGFICGEGRPDLQGHLAVLDLAAVDAVATITTDMALFGFLSSASALVIGAAALAENGMIVRVGTPSLTRAARDLEIPVLATCMLVDAVPAKFPLDRLLTRGDAASIMSDTDTIRAISPTETIMPLDMVDTVITEDGTTTPAALSTQLADIELYPGLLGRMR